jgi:RHS repeat-associated protein
MKLLMSICRSPRFFHIGFLLLVVPAGLHAQFNYRTNNGGIMITGYTGPAGAVAIPDTITGLPVTSIGDFAFNAIALTGVSLPASVTYIGTEAFAGTSLTNITIPNRVTYIGQSAFSGCAGLAAVTLPDTVTNLGTGSFESCSSLVSVTIPGSIDYLGDATFQGCTSLSAVAVSNGVTTVGIGTFSGCSALTSITIPDTVTSILDESFFGTGLTNITLSEGLIDIGNYAFFGSSLINASIPNSVISIGSSAFSGTSLITITIPSGITNIADGTFQNCTNLIGIYFQGNAPGFLSTSFFGDTKATVYYQPGTSGWTSNFAGLPTVMLNPPNPSGSLQVTITPSFAVTEGARWQVDGGILQPSGATVLGLSVGNHTVSFTAVSGYPTPPNQIVSITANVTTTAVGNYQSQTGSLQVTITPTLAISDGALWQVDGGPLETSGATLSGLSVGSHTVSFTPINGWTAPANQIVAVSANSTATVVGNYVAQTGALQVTITPAAAIINGAQWQVDGGAPQSSGATVSGLSVGSHTVSFTTLTGWTTPASQFVTVSANTTTTAVGNYVEQTGALQVTITPALAVTDGAIWEVDGGTPHISGATVSGLSVGSHNVSFTTINGWMTPVSQSISVSPNWTASVVVTYVEENRYTFTTNNGTITITGYTGPGGALTIPDAITGLPVTGIGSSAFAGVSDLTSVTLPAGITTIGNGAFAGCANLASVYFLGNAPAYGLNVFTYGLVGASEAVTALEPAIVYYAPETTGWTSTFGGLPTELAPGTSLSPTPVLSITRGTTSAFSINWPKASGVVSLQTSTDLSDSQGWQDVSLAPFESQGLLTTLVPMDTPTRFFRPAFSSGTSSASTLFDFPQLTITQPVTDFLSPFRTNAFTITLAGTVSDPSASVMVQGVSASQLGANWVANGVSLNQEGPNLIVITATNLAGAQTVQSLIADRVTSLSIPQPPPPQVLAVSPSTNRIIWNPLGPDIASMRIFRRPSSSTNLVPIAQVPAPAALFDDTNLSSGVTFCYTVQAVDAFGDQSQLSPETCASPFGVGFGGGIGLTGGSVDPAGNTSSAISASVLTPVTPVQETNGNTRVRYFTTQSGGYFWETDGPQLFQLFQAGPNLGTYYLVENDSGFGSSLSMRITLPPGFIFNSTNGLPFQMFATFPNANPAGNVPFFFFAPFYGMPTNTYDLGTYYRVQLWSNAVQTLVTSNTETITASFPPLTGPGSEITGSPNILALQLFSLGNYMVGNPTGIAEPSPKVQITINGLTVEAVVGLPLDPDPSALAPLAHSADDAGGAVNLLSGDYSFQVPLFKGRGYGLNLDCFLSYSSWNTFYHQAVLQQSNPRNFGPMPFGPGWSYPYGMRLIPQMGTYWGSFAGNTPTNGIFGILLVGPDGRVTPNPEHGLYDISLVQPLAPFPLPCQVHRPAPDWAHFSSPFVYTNQTGYAIREAAPNYDGFQELDFDFQGRLIAIIPHGGAAPITITYSNSIQTVTDSSGRPAQFIFDSPDFLGKILEIIDPAGGDWKMTYSAGGALTSIKETGTGYSWEFAYDPTSYLLTERKLPHGFIVQSDYATATPGTAYPTNFFWGTLAATKWKETPSTSTRTFAYQPNFNPNSWMPERVAITTPSGRNTLYFDTDALTNVYTEMISNNFVGGVFPPRTTVVESDRLEQDPRSLRFRGSELCENPYQILDYYTNAALGVVAVSRYNGFFGDHIYSVTREDSDVYSWPWNGQTTFLSPTESIGWRGPFNSQSTYTYYNPKSLQERLKAVFPPGQDPANPAARSIQYLYDATNRLQFVINLDSNVTQFVYFENGGKRGLPNKIIPLSNLSPPTTTGLTNPYAWTFDYDRLGRTTLVIDPNQNVTQYAYDTAGRLKQILGPTNASGNLVAPETDFTYQGDLLIQQSSVVSGGPNQTVTYIYDNQARLTQVLQPGNSPNGSPSAITYAYDADNNPTNIVYPTGGIETRQYDNRGRLTMTVGPMGETTQYTYDDSNDEVLDTIRLADGQSRKWSVLARDAIRRVTDFQLPTVTQGGITGRPEIHYTYDPDGNITSRTFSFAVNSNSVTSVFGYFDETTLTTTDMGGGQAMVKQLVTDYAGRTVTNFGLYTVANFSAGTPYIQFEPGRTGPTMTTFTYSPFDTISNILDAVGNERVRFGLDSSGLPNQISIPNPAVAQRGPGVQANTAVLKVTRDRFNLVGSESDVFGNTTLYSRDQLARSQSVTDPTGTQVKQAWSSAGDPAATATTAGGNSLDNTRTFHDDFGSLTQVIAPGNNGAGTSFKYDLSVRMTNSTDAAGHVTSYVYNGFGELVQKTYPTGDYITYAHDALGRITNSTEYLAGGVVTRVETTTYDWKGDLSSVEDGNYLLTYLIDNLGRLLQKQTVFKSLGITNTLNYRFGEYGDFVSEQSSEGYTVQYVWDDLGNLVQTFINPPGGAPQQITLHPDAVGRLTGWDLFSNLKAVASAAVTRDQKGHLTQLTYSAAGLSPTPLSSVSYSYNGLNQVTNILDHAKGLICALGYDPRGYLNFETWWQSSNGTPVYQDQLGYDPAGNRVSRQLDGNVTTYTYNSTYQLIGENAQTLARVPQAMIRAAADSTNSSGDYDPNLANDGQAPDSQASGAGWRSDTNATPHWLELDLTNGAPVLISAVEVSAPSARGGLGDFQVQVSSSSGGPFHPVELYLILQGYRVSTNAAGTHQHSVRVTFVSPQVAAAVRIFVPQGGTALNPFTLVQLPDAFINEVALYQAVNQVVSRTYDANGRLVSDGTFTYSYDVQGRLTGVTGPGANKTWTITPEGLRGSERDDLSGQTRYFANDGAGPYFEFTVNGGTVAPLLRHFNAPGADNHLGFFEYTNGAPQFRWTLIQGPGSVQQVLDSNGNVLDDRLYTAWGEDLLTPTSASANPYGFAGSRHDPDTGLYYNRARMYNPHAGRFNSGDPLGIAAGANLYLYASNDSVNGRDSSGLDSEPDTYWGGVLSWFSSDKNVAKAAAGGLVSLAKGALTHLATVNLEPINIIRDALEDSKHNGFIPGTPITPNHGPRKSQFVKSLDAHLAKEGPLGIVGMLAEQSSAIPGRDFVTGIWEMDVEKVGAGFADLESALFLAGHAEGAFGDNAKVVNPQPARISARPIDPQTARVMSEYNLTPETEVYRTTPPEFVNKTTGVASANPESMALVEDLYKDPTGNTTAEASDLPDPSLNVSVKRPTLYHESGNIIIRFTIRDVLEQGGKIYYDRGANGSLLRPFIVTLPEGGVRVRIMQ